MFPEEVDKFCYDLSRDEILRIQRDMLYSMSYMDFDIIHVSHRIHN